MPAINKQSCLSVDEHFPFSFTSFHKITRYLPEIIESSIEAITKCNCGAERSNSVEFVYLPIYTTRCAWYFVRLSHCIQEPADPFAIYHSKPH